MKVKKMIDSCKQNKCITIFNTENEQWISDGHSAFPMYDLPLFDTKTICLAYDITEKQQKKIVFNFEKGLPENLDFSDTTDDEVLVDCGELVLLSGGCKLIPYMTSEGIEFVDGKYLSILSDMEDGMLELYERHTKSGNIYFAIKSGFVLVGVVMPVKVINDDFVDRIKALANQCEVALYNQKPKAANPQQKMNTED